MEIRFFVTRTSCMYSFRIRHDNSNAYFSFFRVKLCVENFCSQWVLTLFKSASVVKWNQMYNITVGWMDSQNFVDVVLSYIQKKSKINRTNSKIYLIYVTFKNFLIIFRAKTSDVKRLTLQNVSILRYFDWYACATRAA